MHTERAIYATQAAALRARAEDAASVWRPVASGQTPADAVTAASEQMFTGAERLFACTQKTSSLIRDFGWPFSALCVDNAMQISNRLQAAPPKGIRERV
jgi:hypothetical protein